MCMEHAQGLSHTDCRVTGGDALVVDVLRKHAPGVTVLAKNYIVLTFFRKRHTRSEAIISRWQRAISENGLLVAKTPVC
jgi:hypothetical protein